MCRYQNKHTIEYEDIVSGRGLEATYEWAALGHEDAPKTLKAHEIVAQALKVAFCFVETKQRTSIKKLTHLFTPFVGTSITKRSEGLEFALHLLVESSQEPVRWTAGEGGLPCRRQPGILLSVSTCHLLSKLTLLSFIRSTTTPS